MIGKNNPFNIRFVRSNHWIGQTGQTNGFVDFSDRVYGIRAAAMLVMRSYRSKGVLTISEIINRYAPPTENRTKNYIKYVSSALCAFPFDILNNKYEYYELLAAMSRFEGNSVNVSDIKSVCEYFNINLLRKENEAEDC